MILGRDVRSWRQGAVLLGLLSGLAVLIAVVGTYGHMASWVAGRYHELGVRMALGLDRQRLVWLVIRQALLIGGAGALVGILGSLALYRLIQNLLFEVAHVDPLSLGGSALLVMGVAIAGSLIPCWRALRVAPSQLLRTE
ncbi:MAG: FtsX-like permease family protein [Acidobacteriota bacterium]